MKHPKSSILSVLLVVGAIWLSPAYCESYHPPGSSNGGQGSYGNKPNQGSGSGGQGSYGNKPNHGSGSGGQGSYGNKPNQGSGNGGQGSYGNKPNQGSGTGGQGSYGNKPNYGSGTGGQGSYGNKPNYGSGTGGHGSYQGSYWGKPDYGSEGYHACERETERKIRRKHESARHIRWDERSVRQWRESSNKTGYRGWGDFVGGKGRGRRYEFECIYNHKKHRVNSAWVNVKER